MRRIETRAEVEKKSRNKQIVIGAILVGLMILSVVGYGFLNQESDDESVEKYRNFKFIRQQGLWYVNIEEESFGFQYLPREVEDVLVSGVFNLNNYKNNPLYFVGNGEGGSEILNNLNRYVLRAQNACLAGLNCSNEKLPVKTCDDNLIVFENGETKVGQNNRCVYLSGDSVRAADAFLYNIFGII